jgi:hypothetical protein
MDRRTFLKTAVGAGAVAAAGGVATPAISQSAAARALRLVPHADLSNFDPIWSNAYIARNAGILVWDTLYGVDAKLQPQRQMVEAEQVSGDGLTGHSGYGRDLDFTMASQCARRTRSPALTAGGPASPWARGLRPSRTNLWS